MAALFYSLTETAKLRGEEPGDYLLRAALAAIENPGTITLPMGLDRRSIAQRACQLYTVRTRGTASSYLLPASNRGAIALYHQAMMRTPEPLTPASRAGRPAPRAERSSR